VQQIAAVCLFYAPGKTQIAEVDIHHRFWQIFRLFAPTCDTIAAEISGETK
jgi:hypothetical protein